MRAGTLNSRVVIKSRSTTQDAIGQQVETWSTVATVWANIRFTSGKEAIKSGAETSTARASIRIRKRADVTAAMRVYHGSVIYDIEAVLPDEERREHCDLVCARL